MENNLTVVTEFFLLGFRASPGLSYVLFCLLLIVFDFTIFGNLLIITLVSTSKILQTPMYFFISQLSISDILVTTDIVPNLLHILLNNGAAITFVACLTQLYFCCVSVASECFLLAVMSYDRYVAICNPLRYTLIMTRTQCAKLAGTCWSLGSFVAFIDIYKPSTLTFCGPNIIDHFFCDLMPLVEISCSDIFFLQVQNYVMSIPALFIPTVIILVCYGNITVSILRMSSYMSRQKAFSTCSSHLIVVSIFYWSIFSVYVVPTKGQTSTITKSLSLLYTVFTPLTNPIIYSLRNKDISKAVKEIFHKGSHAL